jgi:uncharacterized protein DUF5818
MKLIRFVVLIAVVTAPATFADNSKTYVGVITDTMCATNHKPMNVSPDAKCVKECVRDGTTYKYALADGKSVYTLSDQETPAQFAGKRVKVTGVLYTKTNILKVDAIALAN